MKLLVMADSHKNKDAVREVVFNNLDKVDRFIHLGDGVEELLEVMDELECMDYLFVSGNHEEDKYYNITPDYQLLTIGGHKLLITHGDKYYNKLDLLGVAHIANSNGADIALCGHTHIACDEEVKGVRIINPGALEYWRDDLPKYAIIDINDEIEVVFFEGRTKHES